MKELSIEEKAQRYDKALERAKIWKYKSGMPKDKQGILDDIFYELKESENYEKIKKRIIQALHGDILDIDEISKCIAWLEKQGELIGDTDTVDSNEDGLIAATISSKSTNKVKPKFYEGDWITIDKPCQVISIDDNENYIVQYCDDEKTSVISKKFCEFYFHFWTIQDAKDGDVLIKSGSRECPFIFKETKPSDIKTDILNPLAVLGYCGIGGAGFTKGSGWGDTANCIYYPATKEQRDTLEKAMADAGYTFDFKEKVLKKIEQKSAWSEEDENLFRCAIDAVEQESKVRTDGCLDEEVGKMVTDWLKSIKDRYTWKPSEKQMKALNTITVTGGISYAGQEQTLINLYNDLKKLKG